MILRISLAALIGAEISVAGEVNGRTASLRTERSDATNGDPGLTTNGAFLPAVLLGNGWQQGPSTLEALPLHLPSRDIFCCKGCLLPSFANPFGFQQFPPGMRKNYGYYIMYIIPEAMNSVSTLQEKQQSRQRISCICKLPSRRIALWGLRDLAWHAFAHAQVGYDAVPLSFKPLHANEKHCSSVLWQPDLKA